MKKSFLLALVALFAISLSITLVNTDMAIIGKVAEDGTRLVLSYYDPYIDWIDENNNFQDGAERPLIENSIIEYQELYVYLLFGNSTTKDFDYNITYSSIYYNETLDEYIPIKILDIIGRTIRAEGSYHVKDIIEMPVHVNLTLTEIKYLNLKYTFFHQTSEIVRERQYTGYELHLEALKQTGISFLITALGGVSLAFAVMLKAGNFDFEFSYVMILILSLGYVFLIITQYVYYISIRVALFYLPEWALWVVGFILTFCLALEFMNKLRKRKYWRCAVYDVKAMTVEPHLIPLSQDETQFMEKGLKASCIRLVSAKGYENSIQFGSFQESEVIERVAVKSDKVDSKAEEFAKKGFTVEISKAETEEGYTQLILSKKVEIFKETELVPRWAWKSKTKHVLQEYICTKVKPHKAHVKLKSWGWTPSGILASIALILSFVYNNPQRSVDLSLKLTLWIAVGVFFLITLGYHSIAGKYEIEVCEPHIALGILKANMHLLTAEKDAQTIATLKDELFRLKASRQIDSMSEGEKMSAILIDEMLAFIENLENESK